MPVRHVARTCVSSGVVGRGRLICLGTAASGAPAACNTSFHSASRGLLGPSLDLGFGRSFFQKKRCARALSASPPIAASGGYPSRIADSEEAAAAIAFASLDVWEVSDLLCASTGRTLSSLKLKVSSHPSDIITASAARPKVLQRLGHCCG